MNGVFFSLHKFATGNLTYTTTKECYLYGSINASQNTYTTLTIDGNVFASVTGSQANYYEQGFEIGPIRLKKGTVVTLSSQGWNPNLYILEGTIVSGDTYVYNEAEVELDYGNPLHTFTDGNLSYTATKNCWIFGSLGKGNAWAFLTINGVNYGLGSWTSTYATVPFINIKLKKGDIVSVDNVSDNLHVLEGTVSGSVGGLGEPPSLNYTTPLHKFTNSALTYTATKTCYLFGSFECSNTGNAFLSINGNQMYHARYYAENNPIPLNVKLTKGDTISISTSSAINETLYILETL